MAASDLVRTGQSSLAGFIPTLPTNVSSHFNPLTASGAVLQALLQEGKTTSIEILEVYQREILNHNGYLKAVWCLNPKAHDEARALDQKRADGNFLGPLHGIPVLLKDNVGTEPGMGMDNTGGNPALLGSTTSKNAYIVEKLLAAGAVILGKATLSEMMWFKGTGIRCGWASLHGQSQNPYVPGGQDMTDGLGGHSSCGGSSSGSGIAVAAGLAPMAIGTETEGSLLSPSTRQSLWTVKPTRGIVPGTGIIPVSYHLDTAGPMCGSVQDVSDLLTVLVDDSQTEVPSGGYSTAMKGSGGWKDLRVGTLDPTIFRYDESFQEPVPEAIDQIKAAILAKYDEIKLLVPSYHAHVDLRPDKDFELDGANVFIEIMVADFQRDFDAYLAGTVGTRIKTTKELVDWNRSHSELVLPAEYPNQEFIERSAAYNQDSHAREKLVEHANKIGQSFFDTLAKYDINIIIGPADSWVSKYSAATGCPLAGIPMGYIDYKKRPIGLVALAEHESTLITFMSAFESSFNPRKPPTAYQHRSDKSLRG